MNMAAVETIQFVPGRKRGSRTSPKTCMPAVSMAGSGCLQNSPVKPEIIFTSGSGDEDIIQSKRASNGKAHPEVHMSIKSHSPRKEGSTDSQISASDKSKGSKGSTDLASLPYENFHINDTGYSEIDLTSETSALNTYPRMSSSRADRTDRYVTMTGTVKRGKKKGQTMDMKVHMSREELDELENSIILQQKEQAESDCFFGKAKGPHVLIFTIFLSPIVFVVAAAYSFYMGTMTWYNILVYLSEKKTLLHKLVFCPLLIVTFPFTIVLFTLGLGIYALIVQISWHFEKWKQEVPDWEKGFYGWLCCSLHLEDCAPYEVVVLTEIQSSSETDQAKSRVGDTAL